MEIEVKIERKNSDHILGVVNYNNITYPWKLLESNGKKRVIFFSLENLDKNKLDEIIKNIFEYTGFISKNEKAYIFLEDPYNFIEIKDDVELKTNLLPLSVDIFNGNFYKSPLSNLILLAIKNPMFKKALLNHIRKNLLKRIKEKNI